MKLLTCNVHSLREKEAERKLQQFVDMVCKEQFDIIALQEVSQTRGAEKAGKINKSYYMGPSDIELTRDNYIMRVTDLLEEKGFPYYWAWSPIKIGYGILDEGIAILSRKKPEEVISFYISSSEEYENWHARKVIAIQVENTWYYSVHMGWWKEEGECFADQWKRLKRQFPREQDFYVMGDFNNPAHIQKEGYDMVCSSGLFDTYCLADHRDEGMTVVHTIDGWEERKKADEMRIDFIFKNNSRPVLSSEVILNGKRGPVVSDHFGVMIEEGK